MSEGKRNHKDVSAGSRRGSGLESDLHNNSLPQSSWQKRKLGRLWRKD